MAVDRRVSSARSRRVTAIRVTPRKVEHRGHGMKTATGRVIKFDDIRGYGFVSPDTGGEDLFVHVNDLYFDKQLISTGVQVEFIPEEGERGLKASRVRLLEKLPEIQPAPSAQPLPANEPAPGASEDEDDLCDVLSVGELKTELLEALVEAVPDLTGTHLVTVRQCVVTLARKHGWIEN
ncbi:cold-shock protein [Amycolatopsis sp. NPDC058986]|uniref:cold-shock protein n=1 Tax=unclassified Amycolatopsis TaxID=2618356 RepID=UPI00366D5FA3